MQGSNVLCFDLQGIWTSGCAHPIVMVVAFCAHSCVAPHPDLKPCTYLTVFCKKWSGWSKIKGGVVVLVARPNQLPKFHSTPFSIQ